MNDHQKMKSLNTDHTFFRYDLGGKILCKDKSEDVIVLKNSRSFFKSWTLVFIGFAIFISILLIRGSKAHLSWFSIWAYSFFILPFFIVGIIYYQRSNANTELSFHLHGNFILLNRRMKMPFNKISNLSISAMPAAGLFGNKNMSYQLNMNLKNGSTYLLVTSDSADSVHLAANTLKEFFGFEISTSIDIA